jgi:hypothetical protein
MGQTLEESFTLPQGNAWKSMEEKADTERTVTYTRIDGATVE